MDAAEHFVEVWMGLAQNLPDDYGCQMTCGEADALADLFAAFGYTTDAAEIVRNHAAFDEPGDSHFIGPLEEG